MLRNREKWQNVELLAIDRWSLRVCQAYALRLIAKHVVDYYVLAGQPDLRHRGSV
jgi:hypothetical protein